MYAVILINIYIPTNEVTAKNTIPQYSHVTPTNQLEKISILKGPEEVSIKSSTAFVRPSVVFALVSTAESSTSISCSN